MRITARILLVSLLCAGAACQPPSFTEIARGKLSVNAPGDVLSTRTFTAINGSGMVAFVGQDGNGANSVFAGNGGPVTVLGLGSTGLETPDLVKIDDANEIAFHSQRRGAGGSTLFGIYTMTLAASAPMTLIEAMESDVVFPEGLGLSPNGTLATSTMHFGQGALLRGPLAGPLTPVSDSSARVQDAAEVAVNDAGQVAAEVEYMDPDLGIVRGILVFPSPGQTLGDAPAAIEQLGDGKLPTVAIDGAGEIAFSLASDMTIGGEGAILRFYDPPFSGNSAQIVQTVTLHPGVYVSHPRPLGTPPDLTLIVSQANGFASFSRAITNSAGLPVVEQGRVVMNATGSVVFEAWLPDGRKGIFAGRYPGTDYIVIENDSRRGPGPFSSVDLGDINDAGELSFHGVDASTGVDVIYRVSGF
jgi:hypothetical protein